MGRWLICWFYELSQLYGSRSRERYAPDPFSKAEGRLLGKR